MANSSYFGVKLGEAINAGAGHITDALQRKYQMQKMQEQLDRQNYQQDLGNRIALESRGVSVPNVPASENWGPMGANQPMKFPDLSQLHQDYLSNRDLSKRRSEAEIGRLGQGPKAPTGYMWNPDGGLAAIPGGPAEMKINQAEAKKSEALRQQTDQAQNVIATVDNALGKIGYKTAGWFGNKLSGVAGTEAADLEANLKTIKANLGFDRLTQMRLASPTGGALGQVSDREIGLLTSAVQNLEQTQSPTQLKKNLQAVKEHYSNWLRVMEQSGNMGIPEQGGGLQESPIALPADKAKRLMELRAKKAGK